MSEWYAIRLYPNQIVTDTGSACLIQMPHQSDYDGYSFWHPSKLVRDDRRYKMKTFSYTDNFVFRLKKYGKGVYNRYEVIQELEIGADELVKAFENNCDSFDRPELPLIYTPQRIEPEGAVADESLIDD